MAIRSFLAFELPKEIREIISRGLAEMKKRPLDLRWVKPENIHLTVVFLGSVREQDLDSISDEVSKVCGRYGPFDISLNKCGVFGSRRNPRVLWIGLDGDIKRMAFFKGSLTRHLKPFGMKEEKRRFNPHLTLGRFRKGARGGAGLDDLLEAYAGMTSPGYFLKELVLFKSDLKPGGAVYTRLASWPLEGTY